MAQAKNGDTVKVNYTGTLDSGEVFDSSVDRDPIEFTIGQGHVIPGFEEGVLGLAPGESKTVTIPFDKAYGPHREDMVLKVGREQFPDEVEPELGMQLQVKQPDGPVVIVTVTDATDAEVTLDANHPLAGKDLTFSLELVEIA